MILFSSKKLEKALAEQKIPNWQKVKYVIIPAIIMAPAASTTYLISPRSAGIHPTIVFLFKAFFIIVAMFITYFGIKTCFEENQRIDKQNFIERFCILLLPILLKLAIIFIALSWILLKVIFIIAKPNQFLFQEIVFSTLPPIYTAIYYSLLKRSFERLGELIKMRNFLTSRSSRPEGLVQ